MFDKVVGYVPEHLRVSPTILNAKSTKSKASFIKVDLQTKSSVHPVLSSHKIDFFEFGRLPLLRTLKLTKYNDTQIA